MSINHHTVTTFTIDSHPDPAACIEYVRHNWHDLYCWHDENAESLKAFCDHFGTTDPEWEVSMCSHSYATAWPDAMVDEMRGVRLWKYLQNSGLLTYHKPGTKSHARNTTLLDGHCPFTGFHMDECLLDPLREFMARPDQRTFQELINDCLHAWVQAYVADWEFTYSDDWISEHLEINGYEFTESGEFYA